MKEIIKSKEDAEIFFSEILNPKKPNKALKEAYKLWKQNRHKYTTTHVELDINNSNN